MNLHFWLLHKNKASNFGFRKPAFSPCGQSIWQPERGSTKPMFAFFAKWKRHEIQSLYPCGHARVLFAEKPLSERAAIRTENKEADYSCDHRHKPNGSCGTLNCKCDLLFQAWNAEHGKFLFENRLFRKTLFWPKTLAWYSVNEAIFYINTS